MLGVEGIDGSLLLGREIERVTLQLIQPTRCVVGEADSDLDPLPTLGCNFLGSRLELLGNQAVQQRCILQPAAVIRLEQVVHHDTTRGLIGVGPTKTARLSEARTVVSVSMRRI